MFKVTVKAIGNPDKGQDPNRPLYGVEPQTFIMQSIADLRDAVWDWQIDNDIGSGNWLDSPVYKEDQYIGLMSYNGRIWAKEGEEYK